MLSKKRRPSRKSVGSVSSDKSPGCRSQLDDTGNTTADVLVEAPNGAQLSPGSALSSTGTANSFTNGARNILQGRAALSDNQNTVRTLPEEAAWGVETDQDDTFNLPPPPSTNISNLPHYNAFSWPLFATDTDWQFDFDIPFTAEPTSASTGASSTALTELDMSQSYDRPTQGVDSAGCSGEWIGYLCLNEKVSPDAACLAQYGRFYT